jgi:hypothetical protein
MRAWPFSSKAIQRKPFTLAFGKRRRRRGTVPGSRLREINRVLENTAWGAYRIESYPTYDYKAVGIAAHEKAQ